MASSCCIVVPIHTMQMDTYQYASIVQTAKKLHNFDMYIAYPNGLDVSSLEKLTFKRMPFDQKWFASYGAYNRLCMSKCFYAAFTQYDYMLIAQTDTWIFKDELQHWCNCGYDYIGAPLCHYCKNIHHCNYVEDPIDVIVGNGGLSLRRIKKFIDVTSFIEENHLLNNCKIEDTQAEDVAFMRLPNVKWNVPHCCEAIKFSIESLAVKHAQNGIIPFGYHNLLKIFPQAALMLHFNNNVKENIEYFNTIINA